LGYNNLGNEGAKLIASATWKNIVKIDLCFNKIGDEGVK
jgi:hypothetical protein